MDYSYRFIDGSVDIKPLNVFDLPFSFMLIYRGHTYIVVYGSCAGGHFVAIPNWNVSATGWEPNHISYNTEQILDALDTDYEDAAAIAEAICWYAFDTGYFTFEDCVNVV